MAENDEENYSHQPKNVVGSGSYTVAESVFGGALGSQDFSSSSEGKDLELMSNQTKVVSERIEALNSNISSLDKSIDQLKKYQARSSSVETIFTLSILSFTFVQATGFNISKIEGASILLFSGLWALSIGGKTLARTTARSIPYGNQIYDIFADNTENMSKTKSLEFLKVFMLGFLPALIGTFIGMML